MRFDSHARHGDKDEGRKDANVVGMIWSFQSTEFTLYIPIALALIGFSMFLTRFPGKNFLDQV